MYMEAHVLTLPSDPPSSCSAGPIGDDLVRFRLATALSMTGD